MMTNLFSQYTDAGRTQAKRLYSSKKKVLETLSELLSETTEDSASRLDGLLKREKLGSTALKHGIAIPHTRANISTPCMAVITLHQGIDFDSPDGVLTDIFIATAVPIESPETHLDLLAQIVNHLNHSHFCKSLRKAHSDDALFNLFSQHPPLQAV